MTFLTNVGVAGILRCFRLGFEWKAGKVTCIIPVSSKLEFLEKVSGNYFALSDAEGNTLRAMKYIEEV